MSHALSVAVILVLAALTAVLVPLLVQLRRTAATLDRFLQAAQVDLAQIAHDVHETRLRVDAFADALQPPLQAASRVAKLVDALAAAVQDLKDRYHQGFETTSRFAGGLMGGISLLRALLRRG